MNFGAVSAFPNIGHGFNGFLIKLYQKPDGAVFYLNHT